MQFFKKFKSLQFVMVQGSLKPNITFLDGKTVAKSLKPKIYIRKKK